MTTLFVLALVISNSSITYTVQLKEYQWYRKDQTDKGSLKFWTVTLTRDIYLDHSNLIVTQNTLAYDYALSSSMWVRKKKHLSSCGRNSHIWFMSLNCDFDFEDSKPFFSMTLLPMTMHHNTNFGYKSFSRLEDTLWTNTQTQNLCCTFDLEHRNPIFLQDAQAYHVVPSN